MRIPRRLLDEMVAHAREEAPNECCGMVAAQDGRAVKVFRTRNTEASPLRFNIDGREILRVIEEIEEAGWSLGAIYHSHTRSAAYPSQTDIGFALVDGRGEQWWPGTLYLIVGLAEEPPEVRLLDIRSGGNVAELDVELEE